MMEFQDHKMRCTQRFNTRLTIAVTILVVVMSSVVTSRPAPEAFTPPDPLLTVTSANSSEMSIEFRLRGLESAKISVESGEADCFILPGAETEKIPGKPELPVITRLLVIPPQSGVELRVSNRSTRVARDVQPLINAAEDGSTAADEDFSGICHANSGTETVRIGTPVIMRGYRLIPLIVKPLRWDASTREMEICESIDIELNFDTDRNRQNLIMNPERVNNSTYVDKLVRNLVLNPPPSRDDGFSGGSIAYIIGDWEQVEETIEPLIEWRRRKGWTVDLIVVDEDADRFEIKEEIINAYELWDLPPEFVVLVGDAPGMEGNPFTLPYWNEQRGANTAYETDHHYTTLDGNDLLPEVAVGRLVFNTIPMLRDQIAKIVEYESDPYMGANDRERGWQRRAAVAATDSRSGTSSIDVCRLFKSLAERNGFTNVAQLYWTNQNQQRDPTQFIETNFEEGISFFLYRGWSRMNGFDTDRVNRLDNGRMLPFVVLATCNTGDYGQNNMDPFWSYTERFAWMADGGAIGAVGAAGATHTAYNNLLATSTLRAPFVDEVYSQGWALMAGKLSLYSHYADRGDIMHPENRGLEAWLTEFYIFNLMGDPAVELFTDIPRSLDIDHPRELSVGESSVRVEVTWAEGDELAEGVTVCLYRPTVFQSVMQTDAQGRVDFRLDPDWIDEGEIQITASGPNIDPYLDEIIVAEAEYFIGAASVQIDDDDEGESQGDDDGIPNHAERIELAVGIRNFGSERPGGRLTTELTAVSPHVTVVENEHDFNAAPGPGDAVTAQFVVDIGGGFPNGESAEFQLTASAGELTWQSYFSIPVEGAQLEYDWLEWDDNPLAPGSVADAYIYILNAGTKSTPRLDGRLISYTETVTVIDGEIEFEPVAPNRTEESIGMVRLSASSFHLGGTRADFGLVLSAENGLQDTAFFSIVIDRVRPHQPFGPDNYGYICIDNTDTTWASYPRFEWIEIDPRHGDIEGENTGLWDSDEQDDESVLIDLPFDVKYYDVVFDQATICTNGWIALGDNRNINSARNRRIQSGEVSPAMICPFWDDLITPVNSGIYYWYDEENHLFVVEWSRLRKLGPRGFDEPTETFEVILFDPAYYPSSTGDADILFQYLEVEDTPSAYELWDTPFATVGIGSPDQTDGLEYTYWGELNPGAVPLVPETAIRFTTTMEYTSTVVSGTVSDAESGEPLAGAEVISSYGTWAVSGENGSYTIPNTIIADDYRFTVIKEFYNDTLVTGVEVLDEDENIVNFALLHPEFRLDPEKLELEAIYIDTLSETFEILNEGNGQLEYEAVLRVVEQNIGLQSTDVISPNRRDGSDEMWDFLLDIQVTDSTDDFRIQAVVFTGSEWIVAGGSNGRENNWLYRFSRYGRYLGMTPQPVETRYGFRDMAYMDGAIYAVYSTLELLKINPETGAILRRWEFPEQLDYPRAIAIDADSRKLYASGNMFGIYEFVFEEDSSLSWIARHDVVDPRGGFAVHPYGMGFYRDDADGHTLYLYTRDEPVDDENSPDITVYKYNPSTESIRIASDLGFLDPENAGRGGMTITSKFNSRIWIMACVLDNPNGDHVGVFELGPNTSWINFSPREGTINAGEALDVLLTIVTKDLVSGEYDLVLEYSHNADPGVTVLPIHLSVEVGVEDDSEAFPVEYELVQNSPNPFNPVTSVGFSLARSGNVRISVYDASGRLVESLADRHFTRGYHQVLFDGGDCASGLYFYTIQAGEFHSAKKMVLLR